MELAHVSGGLPEQKIRITAGPNQRIAVDHHLADATRHHRLELIFVRGSLFGG